MTSRECRPLLLAALTQKLLRHMATGIVSVWDAVFSQFMAIINQGFPSIYALTHINVMDN